MNWKEGQVRIRPPLGFLYPLLWISALDVKKIKQLIVSIYYSLARFRWLGDNAAVAILYNGIDPTQASAFALCLASLSSLLNRYTSTYEIRHFCHARTRHFGSSSCTLSQRCHVYVTFLVRSTSLIPLNCGVLAKPDDLVTRSDNSCKSTQCY